MKPIAPTPLRTPSPPRPPSADPITLPPTPLAPSLAPRSTSSVPGPWRAWYVYQSDGHHIGPLSTESLARAWLQRQMPQGACVGLPGDAGWWPLEAVAEVMEAARVMQAEPPPPAPQS